MNTPFLSIIIPVFNRPLDLARALDSLTNQTVRNFEVIVIDDGSSESIQTVTDKYLSRLNLKFLKIDNSGGPARPRNVGIRASQAKWISFLDSDDWWCRSRIAEVCAAIKRNPSCDVFYHKLKVISNDRYLKWWSKTSVGFRLSTDSFIDLMVLGNALPNSSVVVRKSCFNKLGYFNESLEFSSVEDFDYWLRLALNKYEFYFIKKCLGFYWMSNTGISANPERTVTCNGIILNKYIIELNAELREAAISKFEYFAGSVLYNAGNLHEAKRYLCRANRLVNPLLKAKRLFKLAMIHLGLR